MDENLATLKAKLRQLKIDIIRQHQDVKSSNFQEYQRLKAQIEALEKPAASAEKPTAAAAAEAKPAVTSGFFAAAANSEASTNVATNTAKP